MTFREQIVDEYTAAEYRYIRDCLQSSSRPGRRSYSGMQQGG